MSRRVVIAALTVLSVAGLAAVPASAAPRTASAIGTAHVNGNDVQVEVFVQVPRGQSAQEATDQALAEQGARPKPPKPPKPPRGGGGGGAAPVPGGPTFTGLVWDVLPVPQYYNGTGEAVSAQSDLTATQSTWSSAGSRFRMNFGGTTSRCPSIVRECPGPQVLDGFNDVGWASLGGNVLGVTWSTTGGQDEADMALNNGVPWNAGCANVPGSFSAQTVLLHENGHVAGLGHASSTASVMYPSYLGARCALGSLDQDAIRALY